MGAWRVARSIAVLGDEVRAISPRTELGTIGDQAHQVSRSDHNPNADAVVCALDIMAGYGLDLAIVAERIRTSGHPDLAYVIYNRRVAHRRYGFVWRPYTGSNPHTDHIHVSVGTGSDGRRTQPYDSPNPWGVAGPVAPPEEDGMYLVKFAGSDVVYGVPGVTVGGLPALVPLTDWERCKEWIAAGIRYVDAKVPLTPSRWHVTDVDAWPEGGFPNGVELPEVEVGEVDLTAALTKALPHIRLSFTPEAATEGGG